MYGSLVTLPLFMQELLGWNAETAGLWTSPRGIATAICMPIVGYLLDKHLDPRWMIVAGCVVGSIAFFGYSHMDLNSGTWDILVHQINQGIGQTLLFVPLTILVMDPITKEEMAYATSLYSVMRNIGSSMGISFVTTLMARRAQFHQNRLGSMMASSNLQLMQTQHGVAGVLTERGAGAAGSAHQSLGFVYSLLQQQATLLSYVDVFHILGLFFLLVAPLVLFMHKPKHQAHPEAMGEPVAEPLPEAAD
jgi:DHA2 family multidrug resistance protein